MAAVEAPHNAGWQALAARGYADLSPPEAEHAVLELPTNRAEYVGMLEAMGDYPARSPIGYRVPTDAEVEALRNLETARPRLDSSPATWPDTSPNRHGGANRFFPAR